jgi:hypothetical protein
MGLAFLLEKAYLFPLTVLFLVVTVASLAYRAGSRRGFGPFVTGMVASVLLLVGNFAVESGALVYAGIVILIAASVWNAWPKRSGDREANTSLGAVQPGVGQRGIT